MRPKNWDRTGQAVCLALAPPLHTCLSQRLTASNTHTHTHHHGGRSSRRRRLVPPAAPFLCFMRQGHIPSGIAGSTGLVVDRAFPACLLRSGCIFICLLRPPTLNTKPPLLLLHTTERGRRQSHIQPSQREPQRRDGLVTARSPRNARRRRNDDDRSCRCGRAPSLCCCCCCCCCCLPVGGEGCGARIRSTSSGSSSITIGGSLDSQLEQHWQGQ